ncbi:hypothetical protein OSB04_007962 [Centaurea solstitialis]|uniref:Formin-like protein n=1 Tax=Centaurea solstitialis TaxID=347529 RepID=A0AA38WJ18_9ASTR|nr:hypothetical protein OSB04_007962 [Centaurea solstitialis]
MVSFIALVVLLFPLAATMVLESRRDAQQLPLGNLSNLQGTMNEESVEFTDLVEALESDSIDKTSLEKERLLTIQDPQVKTSIVDCNIHFPASIQDIQRWNGAPPIRRKLVQVNTHHFPSEAHEIREEEEEEDEEEEEHGGTSLLEEEIEPIPFTVSKADTDGGGIDNTTIIIVVVSTSIVTFLLATILFCWYTRSFGGGKNDEKPLLSLSTSASQKSFKDSSGDQPFSDLQKKNSSVHASVSVALAPEAPPGSLSASGIPPLKPPPGRAESTLKPPPGRTDLSVHPPPSVNSVLTPPRSPAAAPAPAPAPAPPLRAPSARRPHRLLHHLEEYPHRLLPSRKVRVHRHLLLQYCDPDADDSNKTKLKPFFWDKVMATPDQAMVWNQIRAGSFQFNEEMIENLFGYNAVDKNKSSNKKSSAAQDPSSNYVQIIDSKKAQNLSILLKALNVTTNEVCDALKEGNELPVELIQTLLKMAPTGEEELKLRLYNGDLSRLGTAERFLKRLVEIPFAFKRLESLLFMCTLQDEEEIIKESFQTLEAACVQLRKSRLFLKLLEAVLKTGNRMNDGTFRGSAQAFKLDTLLKLSDVKGVDGKTTLLHFVVLEIIRAEGIRAAKTGDFHEEVAANSFQGDTDEYYGTLGLQVVSRLSSELEDVKKAAILDVEGLTGTVSKFGQALVKAREFLNTDLKRFDKEDEDEDDDDDDDDDEFATTLSNFVQTAEKDVMWMLEEEKRIMTLMKNTADYFHGQAGKDEGLRLFIIVRDFLIILDKVCKEVKAMPLRPSLKTSSTKDVSSPRTTQKNDVKTTTRTQETDETPRTQDEDSPRKIWETKDPQQEQPTDLRHEVDDLHETESSYKIQKTDDGQHERIESQQVDDSLHQSREIDNLLHDTHQKDDDDLEPKTHEDDLRHQSMEHDDPQSKMREEDVSQPKTNEQLVPAIAITDSSNSSSDKDNP